MTAYFLWHLQYSLISQYNNITRYSTGSHCQLQDHLLEEQNMGEQVPPNQTDIHEYKGVHIFPTASRAFRILPYIFRIHGGTTYVVRDMQWYWSSVTGMVCDLQGHRTAIHFLLRIAESYRTASPAGGWLYSPLIKVHTLYTWCTTKL